ncbi:nucleic acid binding protein [Dorcoceras hygrometricum]|uniref:Nucleic acid binding protein n=1 Tax=Dorcoceras hygrometricum TaxID=472368 RepID=A0A2Z7ALR9_9LAMI|nr:nucleic acid binding protein [Dorcoceras hygrometricum]
MALLTSIPDPESRKKQQPKNAKPKKKHQILVNHPPSSSWDQIKNLLACKQIQDSKIHDPSRHNGNATANHIYSYCNSTCTFRDVVHGNTRVAHRSDHSPEGSSVGQEIRSMSKRSTGHGLVRSSGGGGASAASSGRGMQLRKLSGCYECHSVDPSRYPFARTTICACSECGEVFPKIESLEHHQAIRHAVSELGPDDSSRNIVEIIFKSSWLKKNNPICKIERILKVHNTKRTIQRFEDYRDTVKTRATNSSKKNARCAADGNELLRFHCAAITCSLGARGSSSLCSSIPGCGVCTIIRHGFEGNKVGGIRTTAGSGRAHDSLGGPGTRRAMLVCRVIAGRVKRVAEDAAVDEDGAASVAAGSYDSVGGSGGIYSNLEELHVFNPRAILSCFVVIYKALNS